MGVVSRDFCCPHASHKTPVEALCPLPPCQGCKHDGLGRSIGSAGRATTLNRERACGSPRIESTEASDAFSLNRHHVERACGRGRRQRHARSHRQFISLPNRAFWQLHETSHAQDWPGPLAEEPYLRASFLGSFRSRDRDRSTTSRPLPRQ